MKRRIFIAIDLPPEVKKRVAEAITQWRWLPIRWLPPENWHITVIPPVYLEADEEGTLSRLLGARQLGNPFEMRFSKVVLAPPGSPARMIWLEGEAGPEFSLLRKRIRSVWDSAGSLPRLDGEARQLFLHVTLARFEPGDLCELEAKTRVLGEVNFAFEAGEIAVMESRLKPSGAEYEFIAGVPLGGNGGKI